MYKTNASLTISVARTIKPLLFDDFGCPIYKTNAFYGFGGRVYNTNTFFDFGGGVYKTIVFFGDWGGLTNESSKEPFTDGGDVW